MGELWRMRLHLSQFIGMIIVLILFLLAGCGGPLPGSPQGKTILPVSEAEWVRVQPGGQLIIFQSRIPPLGLTMLDVSTGEKVPISEDIGGARWLDDELLYGRGYPPTTTMRFVYYIINLQPAAIIRLEPLVIGDESLPKRIAEADSIYVVAPGFINQEYLLLLLQLDAGRRVAGGYIVQDPHDLDPLLAGHSYKTAPAEFPYNTFGEKYPSPNGLYYYTCHGPVHELEIYSQQGELLSFAEASSKSKKPWFNCYGWAWDSRGVFFQEQAPGPAIGEANIGPLQLLEVKQ